MYVPQAARVVLRRQPVALGHSFRVSRPICLELLIRDLQKVHDRVILYGRPFKCLEPVAPGANASWTLPAVPRFWSKQAVVRVGMSDKIVDFALEDCREVFKQLVSAAA